MIRLKSATHIPTTPNINLMPMLDVVFLILIFFLLTSIVVTPPVLNLTLPEAISSKMTEEKPQINLVIRKTGEIEIDQQSVPLEHLAIILKQKIETDQSKKLRISADREAPFGRFITVLDIVQGLHLTDLEILTQPEKGM